MSQPHYILSAFETEQDGSCALTCACGFQATNEHWEWVGADFERHLHELRGDELPEDEAAARAEASRYRGALEAARGSLSRLRRGKCEVHALSECNASHGGIYGPESAHPIVKIIGAIDAALSPAPAVTAGPATCATCGLTDDAHATGHDFTAAALTAHGPFDKPGEADTVLDAYNELRDAAVAMDVAYQRVDNGQVSIATEFELDNAWERVRELINRPHPARVRDLSAYDTKIEGDTVTVVERANPAAGGATERDAAREEASLNSMKWNEAIERVEAERDAAVQRVGELEALRDEYAGNWNKADARVGELERERERLREVIREAVGKLTNLHCKTKRDQAKLCMAFDLLFAVNAGGDHE